MQAMPGPLTAHFEPRNQRFLAAVVIAIGCFAVAWTLLRYLPGWLDGAGSRGDTPGAVTEAVQTDAAGGSLSDYGLFGRAGGESADDPIRVDVPLTELALKLRGTLAAPVPEHARAIIADADGGQRSYRVGDELPGNATLERVHHDRVIIRARGRLESLPLRDPETATTSAAAGREPGGGPARSRDDELARVRQAFASDPASLADRIALQPVQEDGRIVGMRLDAGVSTALMGQFGIRATDVITEVNGVPLDSEARAEEIINQMQNADRLQVTLLRDGQPRQLTVPLGRQADRRQ